MDGQIGRPKTDTNILVIHGTYTCVLKPKISLEFIVINLTG